MFGQGSSWSRFRLDKGTVNKMSVDTVEITDNGISEIKEKAWVSHSVSTKGTLWKTVHPWKTPVCKTKLSVENFHFEKRMLEQ